MQSPEAHPSAKGPFGYSTFDADGLEAEYNSPVFANH